VEKLWNFAFGWKITGAERRRTLRAVPLVFGASLVWAFWTDDLWWVRAAGYVLIAVGLPIVVADTVHELRTWFWTPSEREAKWSREWLWFRLVWQTILFAGIAGLAMALSFHPSGRVTFNSSDQQFLFWCRNVVALCALCEAAYIARWIAWLTARDDKGRVTPAMLSEMTGRK
jgi:hypothetical protein